MIKIDGITFKNWQGKRIYITDYERRRPCTWGYIDLTDGELVIDRNFTTGIVMSFLTDRNLTPADIISQVVG